jgi:hypothetical protein
MRFFQFTIPDAYIETLLSQRAIADFIDVWGTPWFDLNSPSGRRNAVDNLTALCTKRIPRSNE